MVRVPLPQTACLLVVLSQTCSLAGQPPPPDPAYIAELSDRKLLVDGFDSDTWEALITARTTLKDFVRAREALQIWRRNMSKKGLNVPRIDLVEAALEDAQGNDSAARNARLKFLQGDPKNLQVWKDMFSGAEQLADAADAVERAAKVLSSQEFSGIWIPLVETSLKKGDLSRARTALGLWRQGLLKVKATHPQLDHLLGDLEWSEDRQREAIEAWTRSLQADSKNILILEKLFRAHEKRGDLSVAIEMISRIIKVQDTPDNYCRRAELYILKREWKDARSDVFKANKIDPTANASKSLYPLFEGFDSWFPNLRRLDDQVRRSPTTELQSAALLERTTLLVTLGLYAAAREDAAAALKAAPGSLVARLWLGACTNQTGNVGSLSVIGNAESLLRRADFLRDLNDLALPEKVQRLLEMGQNELAREVLSQQSASTPSKDVAESLLESELKMYETAKRTTDKRFGKALQRLLEIHPDRGDLWLKLGYYQLNNGNLDQAIECARKAETGGSGAESKQLIQLALQRKIAP